MSSKLASRPRTTSTALPSLHCEIDGTPYKTPGRTLVCVTHVCHAPRHAPIYRRIMRFLLWRWGESNQTRTIARVFPLCAGSAPPERHANGECGGVHFASCARSQVAKDTASSMESCIQTDSPRGPHQRTTRGTTTGIPPAAASVSWAWDFQSRAR